MKTYRILIVFALVLIGVASMSNSALAAGGTIDNGSVQASSSVNLTAGKTDAIYNVSFFYTTTTSANTSVIYVTFPSGFTITSSSLATSTTIYGGTNYTEGGMITVTASSSAVTTSTINNITSSTRGLIITLAAAVNLENSTTSFRIVAGIRNSTTAGATASSTIFTDAVGTATSTVSGVTIIPAAATKLAFTTQPASATSGIAFVTQPVVTVQDTYGNTSTTYSGTVTLAADGGGTIGGTITKALVSGVASFSANGVKYTTSTDGGTFYLSATLSPLTGASSSQLTANVVATKLAFTTQPAGAVTGVALTTQPVVTAEDADGYTDTDFTGTVTLAPSTTAYGSISNSSKAAASGVATFTTTIYNPASDGETFAIVASATGLTSATSDSLTSSFFKGTGTKIFYAEPAAPAATPAPVVTTPAPVVTTPAATPAPVVTTPAVVTPTTVSAQQQLLNSLVAQLAELIKQASALGVPISSEMQSYLTPSKLSEVTTNLSVGSVGEEVKMLQQFLNTHGFVLSESGAGSPGQETTRFGGLTREALSKYQASVGISPASGMFGPITRSYLKSLGF